MRVLVTGGTGLIGGHVVRGLLERGHEVRATVRSTGSPLEDLPVELVRTDLGNRDGLRRGMDGVEALVHCAAVYAYGPGRGAEVEQVAVDGTRTVLEVAAEAGVGRAVVTSSAVTCGSSAGPVSRDETSAPGGEPGYFAAKRRQEAVAFEVGASRGLDVVVAAPAVVLGGPAQRLVPSNAILVRYLLDPSRSTFPGGSNVVDARDVAHGHLLLLEHGQAGERYLLGGTNLTWRDLHALLAELAGVDAPRAELGRTAAWLGAAAAEGWARVKGAEPLSTREEADTVGRYHWYDSSRAGALGYRARPAREAVASGLAWLLVSEHLPRWVREGLRPSPDVRAARPLVGRAL